MFDKQAEVAVRHPSDPYKWNVTLYDLSTKDGLQAAVDAAPYWYHRISLPFGVQTPGWAPMDASAYRIPIDLTGKRIADLGAWDGHWSFLAASRGAASVLAIDDFSDGLGKSVDRSSEWRTFDICHRALGHDNVERRTMSVYDLTGEFDHIFCFGVLYHLRHPLLALEKMRAACKGSIHIETAILDNCQSAYSERGFSSAEHAIEFYPGDEFGSNPSNWWNMTLRSWVQLVEAAGFKNVTSWKLTETPTHISQCRGFIRGDV